RRRSARRLLAPAGGQREWLLRLVISLLVLVRSSCATCSGLRGDRTAHGESPGAPLPQPATWPNFAATWSRGKVAILQSCLRTCSAATRTLLHRAASVELILKRPGRCPMWP